MADKFAFIDEAGCFTFEKKNGASTYFIICSVAMSDLGARASMEELRAQMIWDGVLVQDYFHATNEKQEVRDAVFDTILRHDFTIQAQICEKAKAQPHTRKSKAKFYQYPLFYLFRHGLARYLERGDTLHVTAASIGTKNERKAFKNALSDVMCQSAGGTPWIIDFRPSQCDPCLQVADYCAWAIQRKWERGDERSYDLIKDRITYEFDTWRNGREKFY